VAAAGAAAAGAAAAGAAAAGAAAAGAAAAGAVAAGAAAAAAPALLPDEMPAGGISGNTLRYFFITEFPEDGLPIGIVVFHLYASEMPWMMHW